MNNLRIPAATIVLLGVAQLGDRPLFANGSATMSSGKTHTLIIGENNTLWGWGGNGAGQIGDGKIFVYSLDQVIRLRTGETGNDAL